MRRSRRSCVLSRGKFALVAKSMECPIVRAGSTSEKILAVFAKISYTAKQLFWFWRTLPFRAAFPSLSVFDRTNS